MYVGAWALGYFHSCISAQTFRRALTAEIKEFPFSGLTRSGRVWWKVPESDARSVEHPFRGATSFWQSLEEGVGK